MTAMEMTKELAFGAAFGLVTGYAAKKTGSHLVTGGYKKEKIARNELMVHFHDQVRPRLRSSSCAVLYSTDVTWQIGVCVCSTFICAPSA